MANNISSPLDGSKTIARHLRPHIFQMWGRGGGEYSDKFLHLSI